MKKISLWAKNNKWSARFIITGIYILFNILGIVAGRMLYDLQIFIPINVFLLFILLFLAGIMAYPSKRNSKTSGSSFYLRQKTCDFILAASTFCMIVYAGNNYEQLFSHQQSGILTAIASSSLPGDSIKSSIKTISAFSNSMNDENSKPLTWKEKKKLLKKQVKEIKESNENSPAGKVLLIILSVITALGLLYLLAALSCSISCGGAEGLAIAVVVLGTGLIIFLLARVIRSIKRKQDKLKPATGN